MFARRIPRIIFDKKAVSNVISAVILTGAVVALSLSVFAWAQSRSYDYSREYSETVDAETAKLKEKLAFEYIYYEDNPSENLSIYLLNCGTIDDIQIKTVYICDGGNTLLETFSDPQLYLFQSLVEISDLDRGEEGRLILTLSTSLEQGAYYCVKIITERGASFDSNFVA